MQRVDGSTLAGPDAGTVSPAFLDALEAESISIFREVAAEFERPVLLYSIGKDSSVLVRLAQKAFHPAPIPFPLLHIDTTYKFKEMIEFRDRFVASLGASLIVHTNQAAIDRGTQPFLVGTERCCGLLKTRALLDALAAGGFDAAFGGARRDEERSRAKERVVSIRDAAGRWDPRRQRPEPWGMFTGKRQPNETARIFPLSNWTELDVWHYIEREALPVVPLYFATERDVLVRGESLIVLEQPFVPVGSNERIERVRCRMRSLGCSPCTGAIRSDAATVPEIIAELIAARHSERQLRMIDHDRDGSMEMKKREGYF
jgi:sulfate adenylyltransferase subunit 2